jgi:hypothetical protein
VRLHITFYLSDIVARLAGNCAGITVGSAVIFQDVILLREERALSLGAWAEVVVGGGPVLIENRLIIRPKGTTVDFAFEREGSELWAFDSIEVDSVALNLLALIVDVLVGLLLALFLGLAVSVIGILLGFTFHATIIRFRHKMLGFLEGGALSGANRLQRVNQVLTSPHVIANLSAIIMLIATITDINHLIFHFLDGLLRGGRIEMAFEVAEKGVEVRGSKVVAGIASIVRKVRMIMQMGL